ncbi:DUF4275 family protein [Lachnospiraceae bacterium ZAX-1]
MKNWFNRQINRISEIEDDREREKQSKILDQIINNVHTINNLEIDQKRNEKIDYVKSRGVEITKINQSIQAIKGKWIAKFAANVAHNIKQEIDLESYLWHIFSFEIVVASCKKTAKRKFDQKEKDGVFLFYQFGNDVFFVKNAGSLKATDFDLEDDIYVVDEKFQWTYVKTHELQCGPYFYEL